MLGLLGWFALQATVTVYVVELDVVRARELWPRSLTQPPLTQADQDYLRAAAEAETRRPEQHVDVRFDAGSGRPPTRREDGQQPLRASPPRGPRQ